MVQEKEYQSQDKNASISSLSNLIPLNLNLLIYNIEWRKYPKSVLQGSCIKKDSDWYLVKVKALDKSNHHTVYWNIHDSPHIKAWKYIKWIKTAVSQFIYTQSLIKYYI